VTIERDGEGNVIGRMTSFHQYSDKRSRGERDHAILHRRQRDADITVVPVEDEDDDELSDPIN
jgi:hypothetical protein